MKGALWTINSPSFGKYAISGESRLPGQKFHSSPFFALSEPTLSNELLMRLFGCQQNEKARPNSQVNSWVLKRAFSALHSKLRICRVRKL